jgi:Ca-activated chloride channel family protein
MEASMRAFLVMAALCVGAPARAATVSPTSTTSEGRLRAAVGGELVDVPLAHTAVRIRVAGFLVDVEVEQRFVNPYEKKIDATYLFPLPTGAAVRAMTLETSGRTIRGEVRRRADATAAYRVARRRGHVAALLTEERPNLFTQAVANLEPGAAVTVRLGYVEALAPEGGGYTLLFPMVAGPRHVPRAAKLTPEAAAAITAPVLPDGQRARREISVEVELDAGVPVAALRSPSHAIVERRDGARRVVRLADGDTVPNRDLVLSWTVAGARPQAALHAHRAAGSPGSFVLVVEPPAGAPAAEIAARELVLLIDTSSSMAGAPLRAAQAAAREILEGLGEDDTFNIVRFDDDGAALGPRFVAARPRNVALALGWLEALEAAGGTDVARGVAAALALPRDPARLRVVALLTDGYIGNEDEVLAAAAAGLGDARLFAFGVGSAVNRYLLEELALLGRGAFETVRPGEDGAGAARRFHARLARPLWTGVEIDWGGLAVSEVTPRAAPDLLLGAPLVLAGRYARGGSATVRVLGWSAGRRVELALPLTLPEREERPAVAALWARARIAELERQALRDARPELAEALTRVALEAGLTSRHTAFVAVDASRVTAGGAAETVPVPVEIPEGVSREGVASGAMGVGYGYASGGGAGYGVAAVRASAPMVVVAAPATRTGLLEGLLVRLRGALERIRDRIRDRDRDRDRDVEP